MITNLKNDYEPKKTKSKKKTISDFQTAAAARRTPRYRSVRRG